MIKVFNTLSGQKEPFKPRDPAGKKVQMFVCGPTVYDYIHIGNARTFVFFDVVAKYLKHQGYNVNYIQNITDIDNKIIERAVKEGVDPLEYAKKYTEVFKQDMQSLGITAPEYKNATDHIPEVIKQVQTLLDKGNAYIIENDGIYFDLSTFPDYGKLSGRTMGMANDAVSRIDDSNKKRNRGDFALWKFGQPGDPTWPAPFGVPGVGSQPLPGNSAGRPGWHIEDTTITEKYFGPQYDIHGGGQDLIFPHHEAEIAQQESASGLKPFVKYWMHAGFLINKDEKMSKSSGNFSTARKLLNNYSKEALRFYFLSAHYRSPLDFSEKALRQSAAAIQRIVEFVNNLKLANGSENQEAVNQSLDHTKAVYDSIMDNDFNTPEALAEIFKLMRNISPHRNKMTTENANSVIKFLEEVDSFLGIIPDNEQKIPKEVSELVEQREKYRETKDWQKADQLRGKIEKLGFGIEDTVYGPLVLKK